MPDPKVRITNYALAESDGEIVIRGVIHPASLVFLKTDNYQRAYLPGKKAEELKKAFRKGEGVTDVELGMRGERTKDDGEDILLLDPVYIIDGQQRISNAKIAMQGDDEHDPVTPLIGCKIRLNTTRDIERELFKKTDDRTAISANILLRNERAENAAIAAMYRLAHSNAFVLGKRITWEQKAKKDELLTATVYVKIAGRLHAHIGPGRSSNVLDLAKGLEKIMSDVSRKGFISNLETFFDLLDECFGLGDIEFKQTAIVLKQGFLLTLASVLSDHEDFWNGEKLQIAAPMRKKLSKLSLREPTFRELASSGTGGNSGMMLYQLIVNHFNSGRRPQNYLRERGLVQDVTSEDEEA